MTPTERAKHWALETLITQMMMDEKYSNEDVSKSERKARAKIIERMTDELENKKVILDGTVLPESVSKYLDGRR